MAAPNQPPLDVVFAGGITGGHLFCGLAVAEALARLAPELRTAFFSRGTDFERRLLAATPYPLCPVPSGPMKRGLRQALQSVGQNLAGYRLANRLLRQRKARIVVGLGGYASVPTALAACNQHLPLVVVEQNVLPGAANRLLAGGAAVVCAPLPEAARRLGSRRCVVTGNPVRAEFVSAPPRPRQPHLVVLGGSLGAADLNQHMPLAAALARDPLRGWRITHQTGRHDLSAVRAAYHQAGIEAEVTPFLDRLPDLLSSAGLVISRAGGTTLAELAVTATPALLCPLARAADDHQRRNAQAVVGLGAAEMCDLRRFRGEPARLLARYIAELVLDVQRRQVIASHIAALARPQAAADVAQIIIELVHSRRGLAA